MKDKKAVLVADYANRFIWLDGFITPSIAYRFDRMLSKMNRLKCAPIILYIRGGGGSAQSSLEMMREIENSASPVATVAHEYVGSGSFTLTQAGHHRMATVGTKFTFHRAVPAKAKTYTFQDEILKEVERLKSIDAVQVIWFLKRGRPAKEIIDLFNSDTKIRLKKAWRLKLVDGYYRREDFLADRRIVRRRLKAIK